MPENEPPKHNGGAPELTSPSPASLDERIAALAAQVRELGERLEPRQAGDVEGAPAGNPVSAPAASTSQRHAAPETVAMVAASVMTTDRIIAMAEAAAAEIRASGAREAQRIREAAARDADLRTNLLVDAMTRQARSLANLAAEAERIERSATSLRAELHSLNGELQEMLAAVSPRARGLGGG